MADGIVQIPPDSTGKKIDAASLDVGANTVMRQRIVIGDNSATAQFATVTGGALVCTGTFNISAMPATTGVVGLTAGSSVIGDINAISRTVQVAIGTPFTVNNISATVTTSGLVGLTAGTANIGFINHVSATVVVAGVVALGAGTSLIGDINSISRTVQVAVGTPFTINNISAAVVLAAGSANIGFINGISATISTVLAAGTANIGAVSNAAGTALMGAVSLAAGTANIGSINNISASVSIATGATFDYDTGAGTQNLPIFGIAVPAAGGAVAAGNNTMPLVVGINYVMENGTNSTVRIGDSANMAMRVNLVAASAPMVLAAGTNNIGFINGISATISTVLAAGSANIGTINNISAAVVLAAGTANIGLINGISATISTVLAAGTANIGAVSNAAGTALMGAVSLAAGTANIGFINNISATVNTVVGAGTALMGAVSLAAGTANIGFINNISATVTTVISGYTPALTSVSHGPTCVTCSTSTSVALIASPGAGVSLYITTIAVSNGGTINSLARLGTSASAVAIQMFCASAGGGFVMNFDPPWMLSASERAICSVKPNSVGNVYFNINFFVK